MRPRGRRTHGRCSAASATAPGREPCRCGRDTSRVCRKATRLPNSRAPSACRSRGAVGVTPAAAPGRGAGGGVPGAPLGRGLTGPPALPAQPSHRHPLRPPSAVPGHAAPPASRPRAQKPRSLQLPPESPWRAQEPPHVHTHPPWGGLMVLCRRAAQPRSRFANKQLPSTAGERAARDVFRLPARGRGAPSPGVRLLDSRGRVWAWPGHLTPSKIPRGSEAAESLQGWVQGPGRTEWLGRDVWAQRRGRPTAASDEGAAGAAGPSNHPSGPARGPRALCLPCRERPRRGQAWWAEGASRRGGQTRLLTGPAPCGPRAGEASRFSWVSPLTPRLP
ncbi:collagen alpha-1(I) chain-like [Balaenoptera musculus]|uniref:Collagen alpha-1(I) chain-like n=1 Tax=Balaenoptera musculus TaxID=9771 RepID=A0A8B8VLJ9_BALMU|nr:collagen alpha-1(I) chain-like [Balaenoptera musculus]XP_036685752.1 collagen alpha-1(I) chain-like [Balaenoptera musculus]XP_036685753.1 collagen alpha-1(I) chain-like [Balaenoptera musculus]XP_036685754.1 collagen alpha-1(I) chain-like [Balaenoptera musculus]